MIKPNWKIFKAKFSENPQDNFEWFCYLLFCKEFNRPYGIFRYKNQSAIETNPIKEGKNVIGWQAKFYDTPLSKQKNTLLNTIEKAKRDYPDITKVFIYTNREWGQNNKGGKPQGLIEIEEKAEKLNIVLVWRMASFFESEFVSIENEIFAKHFFTPEKSIFDLIEEQQKHTENILREIQTSITFNNQVFEIDRNEQLEKLKNEAQQISILSGVGGVGKTVLIKKLYKQLKNKKVPFFVFNAKEFDIRNIHDLYTEFSFYDFSEVHEDEKNKIIVIDSSEKLLDLENSEPFKEFLSVLIKDKWKIIFTTRNNYLEDLNYRFFEIYNIAPLNISVNNLELKELSTISDKYSFSLPKDANLLELIRNPFYLNEYLKFYKPKEELNYSGFKNKLWNNNIKKSQPERERCFLQIAFERANKGQFFISPKCEANILDKELVRDGVLGYETAGYFITHDIYEEWALEKIIESEFIKKLTKQEFFEKIGQSLPIRRSFRNWLSEKLLLKNSDIKIFIEAVVEDKAIISFWKDEILVSVLLSNYSESFFDIFRDELLANEQELLKKLAFILRLACKEVDDDFHQQLGKEINLFSLKYVLTKPKGQGWESFIKFIFDNLDTIGIQNINFVLPIIHDWNSKIKKEETSRFSSLIALQYYQWIIREDVYFSHDNTKENIFQTIFYGASEIKNELKEIFDEILKNKWKNHLDPYYDLSKAILTKLEGISVSKVLPKYVLKLADLFWTYTPKNNYLFHGLGIEIEQYFGLETNHSDYFPASAFQTPIYWLLQTSFKQTIDFILNFTNKSIQKYVDSGFDKSVESVKVFLSYEDEQNQCVSHCLWNLYRGTSSPVSPYLLQSIHMALEKYFLEIGQEVDSKILELWLIYLLRHSKSASITAVVTSIVLAYPEKTFNIAKILFRTKKFFLYETKRWISEQTHKSQLLMLKNYFGRNYKDKLHENERIKACDDKHRNWTLEHLFLYYQCFRREGTSEEEVENRQKILWQILDGFCKELPAESEETESDKTWRIFLARMDRRKMKPTTEKTDDGIAIYWNPEIDSDIKELGEEAREKYNEQTKYFPLKLWSELKFNNDDEYKQYEKYEKDPLLALQEIKDILSKLEKIQAPDIYTMQHARKESFFLFNHSIPAYVCSVLLRDYIDELTKVDKSFCKDVILEMSALSLSPKYQYQISDGVQPAISILPNLLEVFPEERENIKIILLLTIFNEYPVGGMLSNEIFNIFPIVAIHKLWDKNFSDAQSLLFGYLLLKPRYEELRKTIREKNIHESHDNQLMERFLEENEEDLQKVVENKLLLSDIKDISKFKLRTLRTAFQLIPQKTDNEKHKKIVNIIISTFAKKILSNNNDERIDYKTEHDFLETYAYFVLNSDNAKIQDYLKPFLDNFNTSKAMADLFQEFVKAEDKLNTYDKFWIVWNLFKEKVIGICKDGDKYLYTEKIVKSYLFATVSWKETAKEWHSLKDNNKRFFKEISQRIGCCSFVLYAISKLLNDIGSHYLDNGITWIANILDNNQDLANKKLGTNTIYYMENLVRKYIFINREKVRKTKTVKHEVLIILDFLIEKGSVVGYMLRESIA